MFLYELFFRLARYKGIPFYSENRLVPNDHLLTEDVDHDFCFLPIRHFRTYTKMFLPEVKVQRICHVRDPRDILVSQYYSFGWNHDDLGFCDRAVQTRENIRKQTVDDYVLEEMAATWRLNRRLNWLAEMLENEDVTLVTYEEMINDFGGWLDKVIEPMGFSRIEKQFAKTRLRLKFQKSFRPEKGAKPHKRQVAPGEHIKRLQPETVRELNRVLQPHLQRLGYLTTATAEQNQMHYLEAA